MKPITLLAHSLLTCSLGLPAAHVLVVTLVVIFVVVLVILTVVVLQIPLEQSLPSLQVTPASHFGHEGPPQSTPVSLPFLMKSPQVAADKQAGALVTWCVWE
jgi:hypothetical protein